MPPDAAFIGFEKAAQGTFKVGKLADLVVFSEDLDFVSPSLMAEIKGPQTIIDGKVHGRPRKG